MSCICHNPSSSLMPRSVCLELPGLSSKEVSRLAGLLEEEGVAYDIKSYRDAPAGLRYTSVYDEASAAGDRRSVQVV